METRAKERTLRDTYEAKQREMDTFGENRYKFSQHRAKQIRHKSNTILCCQEKKNRCGCRDSASYDVVKEKTKKER